VRVAALYDIHGNLPALEAVLAEVEEESFDTVVVGGDVVLGPMPAEVLDRLTALAERVPVRWVRGNCDRMVLHAEGEEDPEGLLQWVAERLTPAQRELLAGFEPAVVLEIDGLGPARFCHASPRADDESITAVTTEERFAPMAEGVAEPLILCGHTHHQFDRSLASRRVVNAGAVGMPYEGVAAAFWLALGPEVELRRTDYDVAAALELLAAAGPDDFEEWMLRESLREPISADEAARHFEQQALAKSR
jgi:predicted phosphodiesterase